MDRQEFLVKQDVQLKDGRYAVYMGPGKSYGRAAGGKAAVSTNGWVQVFGEYNDYLLIQYAVSADRYRFGWITDDALPEGVSVPELPFVFGDFVTTEAELDLTDDPLNSHNALVTIPEGAAIEYLAQLGEGYSYVRVTLNGRTWWGFVSTWPLGHGGLRPLYARWVQRHAAGAARLSPMQPFPPSVGLSSHCTAFFLVL
jgi:hypothetical protein